MHFQCFRLSQHQREGRDGVDEEIEEAEGRHEDGHLSESGYPYGFLEQNPRISECGRDLVDRGRKCGSDGEKNSLCVSREISVQRQDHHSSNGEKHGEDLKLQEGLETLRGRIRS